VRACSTAASLSPALTSSMNCCTLRESSIRLLALDSRARLAAHQARQGPGSRCRSASAICDDVWCGEVRCDAFCEQPTHKPAGLHQNRKSAWAGRQQLVHTDAGTAARGIVRFLLACLLTPCTTLRYGHLAVQAAVTLLTQLSSHAHTHTPAWLPQKCANPPGAQCLRSWLADLLWRNSQICSTCVFQWACRPGSTCGMLQSGTPM
jgi:hypothetical protein